MFCYYNDCSDELKDEYLANGGQLPTAYKATGIRIQQIHPVTGLPVAEFSSAADVVLKFQMYLEKWFHFCAQNNNDSKN